MFEVIKRFPLIKSYRKLNNPIIGVMKTEVFFGK